MTPQQCRMARAALDLGMRELAELADVSPSTLVRLERGDALHPRTTQFVRGVLEAAGVDFIDRDAISARGGAGVRLGDGPKSARAKLFESIWNLPSAHTEPEQVYDRLLQIIDQYLDIAKSELRELDTWERIDLNDALSCLERSQVPFACVLLRRGITPPDNQSLEYPTSKDRAAAVSGFDLDYFRNCVSTLRARGYRRPRSDRRT